MQVSNNSVNLSNQVRTKQAQNKTSFGNADYKNPVSMKAEYTVATLGSAVGSAVVGAVAGFVAHFVKTAKAGEGAQVSKKFGILVGAGVAAGAFALSIIPKLYRTSVTGFVKQKEMDVFSREKSAETTLAEKIDAQAKNDDVPLSESIGNFAKFQVGKKGNGIGIAQL